jgi:hypothetical protein
MGIHRDMEDNKGGWEEGQESVMWGWIS